MASSGLGERLPYESQDSLPRIAVYQRLHLRRSRQPVDAGQGSVGVCQRSLLGVQAAIIPQREEGSPAADLPFAQGPGNDGLRCAAAVDRV